MSLEFKPSARFRLLVFRHFGIKAMFGTEAQHIPHGIFSMSNNKYHDYDDLSVENKLQLMQHVLEVINEEITHLKGVDNENS